VVLLLVSAALASRPGDEDRIEIVDPSDPSKTIFVEEKYPGESQWLSQIASAENEMREKGTIDKDGHLKNGKDAKKAKKHDD
jgi:hypothetical protein